jgi:hypothetical protein
MADHSDSCCLSAAAASVGLPIPKVVQVMKMGRGDKIAFALRAGGGLDHDMWGPEPRDRPGGDRHTPWPRGFAWAATKVAWEIRRGALPSESRDVVRAG